MAVARFHKTLFLPPLEGQFTIWKNDFAPLAGKVDEVVQLGNLLYLGERLGEEERVALTHRRNLATLNLIILWRSTYANWTQLVGPHEILALNFPGRWTPEEANRLLRRRWFTKDLRDHFTTAAVNKGRLITHGGLTHGEWVKLGRPATAEEAAQALQEKYDGTLYQGPSLRLGDRPNFSANPIFADPVQEVYPSWVTAEEAMPFDQVHSAGGLNTLLGRQMLTHEFSYLRHFEDVKYTRYGSLVTLGDSRFLSLSPDIPTAKVLKHFPSHWTVYMEKVPLVDLRDEMFEGARPPSTQE